VDQPNITAILPCYNHASFLADRISSVLNQTLPVSQIIFLDDASTDESVSLAMQLLDGCPVDVKFNFNSRNSGSPFIQWNKGVHLADHDLIWIAETDDSCHPSLLYSLFHALQQSQARIAFANSLVMGEDGDLRQRFTDYLPAQFRPLFLKGRVFSAPDFSIKYLSAINLIPNASAVLFSRELYLESGGAPPGFRYAGDWVAWLSMAKLSDIAFVSNPYNYYRSHPAVSRNYSATDNYLCEVFEARVLGSLPCILHYGQPTHLGLLDFFGLASHCLTSSAIFSALLSSLPPRLCLSLPSNDESALVAHHLFVYGRFFKIFLLLAILGYLGVTAISRLFWKTYLLFAKYTLPLRKRCQ
jgi:glycosyltransferase involved in cell wall biosynthesis